jgi:hypothetical protein
MVHAIRQWQNAVVAVGARYDDGQNILMGTGWVVDLPAGLVCTCAHVVMDCYPWGARSKRLDACTSGVAIGVGMGETIRWWGRANLLYISLPPSDIGYPHASLPAHWPPPGDALRLDLAVLQLRNWDGTPLSPPLDEPAGFTPAPWHFENQPAIALPLGHAEQLTDGAELVLLGYGQGNDMGVREAQTSTTCRGHYCGGHTKADSGDWLETGVTIYSCASLAPILSPSHDEHE